MSRPLPSAPAAPAAISEDASLSRDLRRAPHHDAGVEVRGRAIDALIAIERGARSQLAVADALDRNPPLPGPDRGLCTELIYGALRLQHRLDAWAVAVSHEGLHGLDVATLCAVRVGLHQLSGLDRIPDFAAIDATIEAAKGRVPRGRIGYLNAVLRRLAREAPWRTSLPPALPPWQTLHVRAFASRAGVDGDALLAALCQAPATHLHVIPAARAGVLAELAAEGVQVARVGDIPGALVLHSGPFWQSRLHARRAAIAQDGASAAVVEWLAAQSGERVLDLCAGRGAKALFLCASGASVDLVDVDDGKLAEAEALLRLAGLQAAATWAGDAMRPTLAPGPYDAVLIDAPCSGLGTLRRRPEIAARRTMADVVRLALLQRAILRSAASRVRPGGRLVYAVCTLTEEEGADVVEEFLRAHPEFERDHRPDAPDAAPTWLADMRDEVGDLRSHPLRDGVDCFYAARLWRRS